MGAGSVGGSGFNVYVNPKVSKTPLRTLLAKQQEDYNNSPVSSVKVKKPESYIFNDEAYNLDEEG